MGDLAGRPDRCAINTATLGFQAPIEAVIDAVAGAGFGGIAPWRREIEGQRRRRHRPPYPRRRARRHWLLPLDLPSRHRPGGLPANIADNKRALDDAATLGADSFVMVVGGLPAGSKDIAGARAQVAEAAAALLDYGRSVGVRIALEPLHPVYAADRSCLSLLSEALDICDRLDPPPAVRPRSVSASTSTIPGGTRTFSATSPAPAPTAASPDSTSATGWCRPATC